MWVIFEKNIIKIDKTSITWALICFKNRQYYQLKWEKIPINIKQVLIIEKIVVKNW